MHARVSTFRGAEGETVEEARERLERTVVPWAQQQPGFKGLIALGQPGGRLLGITLWETEDARRQSAEGADQIREQMSREEGSTIEAVDDYEVVLLRVEGGT